MQLQAKKVYDKAMQIYRTEMGGVVGNAFNKNIGSIAKTHKQLEEELRKMLQKELKGYSQLNETIEKMLVRTFVRVVEADEGGVQEQEGGDKDFAGKRGGGISALGVQEDNGGELRVAGGTVEGVWTH